tara:strand:+ start:5142 stop:6485 length:1344 start_codon:yes stop_codon:yes gene_type:complete
MTINFPTITEIQQRIANDLLLSVNAGQLDSSKHIDPNIRNSGIKALDNSMSAGFDENNDLVKDLLKQLFPQTATGIYLESWASWFGITRKIAVAAQGKVIFTGTATTSIASGVLVQRADGVEYSTQAAAPISAQSVLVTSLTRSGTTATITTTSNHGLATGVSVTISGAFETDYNVTAIISVISAKSFTYTVAGSPTTPATGTILASFTTANILVKAVDTGSNGNSLGGSEFTLVSPLAEVDTSCFVGYNGLALGLNLESDEELRARLLERTSNFSAPFTASGIPVFIKQAISGVTRIWVNTATPSPGYVTIYFTRDNDSNIIPTASQVLAVKNAIIDPETGITPANTPDSYVIVAAPTAVSSDFTFSSLSPSTEAMQTAITNTLTDYFKSDSVAEGVDISQNEYNALIYSVIDADGNSPTFTLSTPSANIFVNEGELATLGAVTYS